MMLIFLIQGGKKVTELCGMRPTPVGVPVKRVLRPCGCGLAPVRGLQQAEPLADDLFCILIAFPLIFDFQPRPLVGVESLEVGTAEATIGRVRRHQQSAIGPAQLGSRMLKDYRCLRRIVAGLEVGRIGRACAQRQYGGQRNAAGNSPPKVLRDVGQCLVRPLSRSASRKFEILRKPSRLGRRPSIGIMNVKLERGFND